MEPKKNQAPTILNLSQYVLNIMDELNTEGMEEGQKQKFFDELMTQASHRVMEAIIQNADPDSLDETLDLDGNQTNLNEFIERWVERSPEAQLAILNALDEMRDEILGFILK
jgi:hypothetical protein